MKAILINPETRTITEIEIKKGVDAIYKAIDCDSFEAPFAFENGDTMYCDEEGLFKEEIIGGIRMTNWTGMIIGKILLLGCNMETGDSKDVETPVEVLKKHIIWVSKNEAKNYISKLCVF